MGLDSIWHWLILLVVVLAVFGTNKLRKIGPDLGHAVREFKKAVHDDDTTSQDAEFLQAEDTDADVNTDDVAHKQHAHDRH